MNILKAAATLKLVTAVAVITAVTSSAAGSLLALDNASNAPYADGWQSGDNGGTGWGGGWTLVAPGSPSSSGQYVGSSSNNGGSPNIDTAGSSWGMYSNSSNEAEAFRPFNGAMSVGQSFAVDFDNGEVPFGMRAGFELRNSFGSNRVEFYVSGANANYSVSDSDTVHNTGIPRTFGGLHLDFTLTSPDTYSVFIRRLEDNQTATVTGTLSGAAGSGITMFHASDFNPSAGGSARDVFYNNMAIVPEPGVLTLLATSLVLLGRRRCNIAG